MIYFHFVCDTLYLIENQNVLFQASAASDFCIKLAHDLCRFSSSSASIHSIVTFSLLYLL
ncbi:hypothetical protein HMPREF9420_0032 [Segatella salivae DSM 15606]|uniref:Uncharacterized protein n=1 Tax=Segatella salivae DSM 15606 TaxID=888832 RepID=E6MKL5_9BACT|nr:hypothetical protein HMPREF9420_0032 [Segatella salivae DSM 15606]